MPESTKRRTLDARLYSLLESLFRELDQEAIHADVIKLRFEHPGKDRRELAKVLTRKAAVSASAVGAGAGATGGALGILAMAPDIFNLVRLQSRLILSIAFLYDHKPHLSERFKEVLATLAISTGASAGRQGARYLLRKGLEGELASKLARKIAGRMIARKLPDIIPLVGGLAGAGLNFLAVNGTGRAAVEYYERLPDSAREVNNAIEVEAKPADSESVIPEAEDSAKIARDKTGSGKRTASASRQTAGKKKAGSTAAGGTRATTRKKPVSTTKAPSKPEQRK
ncbi:MAG: EcsC family protein [Acidobacteriota bacterium]